MLPASDDMLKNQLHVSVLEQRQKLLDDPQRTTGIDVNRLHDLSGIHPFQYTASDGDKTTALLTRTSMLSLYVETIRADSRPVTSEVALL